MMTKELVNLLKWSEDGTGYMVFEYSLHNNELWDEGVIEEDAEEPEWVPTYNLYHSLSEDEA